MQRFLAGGPAALEDRSHAREDRAERVPVEMERRLTAVHRAHPTCGPKKLRAWMAMAKPSTDWSAEPTIGEVLQRAGLTHSRAQPKRPVPPAAPEVPNALWTIDYTGQFRTGDGQWLYPLTVQDAHSRYLLGCAGHRQVSGPATRATLQRVFREHGLPERLRSDYGSPFTSVGAGRLSKLAAWWLKLGLELERIQPGKPRQNGRHERMHRVLKAKTARPPAGGALRPLPRRVQPRPPARGAGVADDGQRACAFGPGVSGTGAGCRMPAALGAAPRAPGRFAEVPRAAAASQRRPRESVGLVEVEEELWRIWFCDYEVAVLDTAQGKFWGVGSAGRRPATIQAAMEAAKA